MTLVSETTSHRRILPRIVAADVFFVFLLGSAYLSFLWFRPLYRDYDPIPFAWDELRWHKAAIFIPWLAIAVVYVRYRLFSAIAVRGCYRTLCDWLGVRSCH
jgi:hypothetical protein